MTYHLHNSEEYLNKAKNLVSNTKAELADATALYITGKNYEFGIEKNMIAAVWWYSKAAEHGNVSALFSLAFCYMNGNGVEKNETTAVEYFNKVVRKGPNTNKYVSAVYNIAICYWHGKGVDTDQFKALTYFWTAANRGHALSQYYIGTFLMKKCKRDDPHSQLAATMLEMSAEQGNIKAQFNIGVCYEIGYGVNVDKTTALKWFHKSEEQGNELALLKIFSITSLI